MHAKSAVSASVVSVLVLAAASACYTAPTCMEQALEQLIIFPEEINTEAGKTFTVQSHRFAGVYGSCAEVCALIPEVTTVHACRGPERVVGTQQGPKQRLSRIICEVDILVCESTKIIGLPLGSGRQRERQPQPGSNP